MFDGFSWFLCALERIIQDRFWKHFTSHVGRLRRVLGGSWWFLAPFWGEFWRVPSAKNLRPNWSLRSSALDEKQASWEICPAHLLRQLEPIGTKWSLRASGLDEVPVSDILPCAFVEANWDQMTVKLSLRLTTCQFGIFCLAHLLRQYGSKLELMGLCARRNCSWGN